MPDSSCVWRDQAHRLTIDILHTHSREPARPHDRAIPRVVSVGLSRMVVSDTACVGASTMITGKPVGCNLRYNDIPSEDASTPTWLRLLNLNLFGSLVGG